MRDLATARFAARSAQHGAAYAFITDLDGAKLGAERRGQTT